ncbi:hypothetical protein FRUB_03765 [Fimbriiglobus ruber]|uniref:Uncharacterized protein n=1 Tax=Fimbriiglobus ruber TaxID=1908690 RepID=A0A225E001_9BACT|nr:hypothetical protein FRUB_03765 [Fimbriiglobus ruber]
MNCGHHRQGSAGAGKECVAIRFDYEMRHGQATGRRRP